MLWREKRRNTGRICSSDCLIQRITVPDLDLISLGRFNY